MTLAFAEMLRVIAVNTKAVGSSLGLVIPNREASALNFVFGGKLPYYYVILAMALGAVGSPGGSSAASSATRCWPSARTRTPPRRPASTRSA